MLIGVPKEIKNHEYRVGLTPVSVREIVGHGHSVIIQTGAGEGIGEADNSYVEAGATIVDSAEKVFAEADMIVKVKEPQPVECKMLRPGQILFTYLHLAPDPEQTRLLVESDSIAIAYETVTDNDGGLPLLAPMSEVAGRMSIQAGAMCLEKSRGGSGKLLGGVPGVAPANVLVIGGGVVGTNAMQMAVGMNANVVVLDRSINRLRELDAQFGGRASTLYSTRAALEHYVAQADLIIGAVLIPGAEAPKLVTREMLSTMRPGSVLVDVAIDQGGCFETSKATTHEDPTYMVDGIVHYCVANMPGAVASTSAHALNHATLPFTLSLANKGYKEALLKDAHLLQGLNVHRGAITNQPVATALNLDFIAADKALSS
ncbi:alanine dehydrogenase [Chromatiales bacterium (ex Bugula neritina AB1)]|nr:alanine dehydrogenase [Chromatiales bacterium (ex Bugula neritina AB1)]